jgi:hypothetical protein
MISDDPQRQQTVDALGEIDRLLLELGRVVTLDVKLEDSLRDFLIGMAFGVDALEGKVEERFAQIVKACASRVAGAQVPEEWKIAASGVFEAATVAHDRRNRVQHDPWIHTPDGESTWIQRRMLKQPPYETTRASSLHEVIETSRELAHARARVGALSAAFWHYRYLPAMGLLDVPRRDAPMATFIPVPEGGDPDEHLMRLVRGEFVIAPNGVPVLPPTPPT